MAPMPVPTTAVPLWFPGIQVDALQLSDEARRRAWISVSAAHTALTPLRTRLDVGKDKEKSEAEPRQRRERGLKVRVAADRGGRA